MSPGPFSPGTLLDSSDFLRRWRERRALRAGPTLARAGMILIAVAIVADASKGAWVEVACDLVALVGLAWSLFASRGPKAVERRRFVWMPMFAGIWLVATANVYFSGGLSSPALGAYLTLFFVGGIIVQADLPPWTFILFGASNLLGWVAVDAAGLVPPSYYVETWMVAVNTGLIVTGTFACVLIMLRAETQLAREVVQGSVELADSEVRLGRARAANAAKGAFLANISHEIRTPLNAILGFSELLAHDALGAAERKEFGGVIRRNGRQLVALIDDVLDLARAEDGTLAVATEAVDPRAVIDAACDAARGEARRKGVTVGRVIEPGVPETVVTDPWRLRRILDNLLSNAVKFTARGSIDVVVQPARTAKGADAIAVTVYDTGSGIARDVEPRLFQPFSLGDESFTRVHGGSGLGLALSRQLARLLGGDLVLAHTEAGKGSAFTLTLAARLEADGAKPAVEMPASGRLVGLSILVAEDNDDAAGLVERYLVADGAVTGRARTGREALAMIEKGSYDVVLMDIQMPEMNGFDATLRLREAGYMRPIVALTACAMTGDRERCLAAGCDAHMTKPIVREDLIKCIVRLTRGATPTRRAVAAPRSEPLVTH